MKVQADEKRVQRSFEIGDMVYWKLQPHRRTSLSVHRCPQLHSKYYGPFRVLAKVGHTSYKILLPEGCQLHHTFHVSQLEKHLGPLAVPSKNLPLLNPDGTILLAQELVLRRKLMPRMQGSISIPVVH